jgi:hypothetical protein
MYTLTVRIQVALPDEVMVPDQFQGFPVDVQFVGPIRPLGS